MVVFKPDEFGSVQFHIEWKTPKEIKGQGQGRGNSGVTFQRRFEIQILDSFENQHILMVKHFIV